MNYREHVAAKLVSGLAGEVVRTFGEIRLRVSGTSMVPAIRPGDMVSVQRAFLKEITPGQIVVFEREGRLIVHRVVGRKDAVESSSLITRGDRLRYDDPPVSSNELLGRVTSVERSGRKIDFATRNSVWMRHVILLFQTSDYATSVYLRFLKLLATGARNASSAQRGFANVCLRLAKRASECRA